MTTSTSKLGYALLGLLEQQPLSGYDLRKLFSATPLISMSDSPGAIYPALQRLEKQNLIRGRIEESSALRRRKIFRLTSPGLAELKEWLAKPVTQDDVIWRMDELILRFAFMGRVLGRPSALQFLKELEAELAAYIPKLKRFLTSQTDIPVTGQLALELGIESYEAHLSWAKRAASALLRQPHGGKA
jgi:DNA-binding PadR family transcriptional regulator